MKVFRRHTVETVPYRIILYHGICMRVLFVTKELVGADIARLLKKERCQVKLFIDKFEQRHNFEGFVTRTNHWQKELSWVGTRGLIIFDDTGYGKIQEELRAQGYRVFGGCEWSDILEINRSHAQKIFSHYGMRSEPVHDFYSALEAVQYIKKHPGRWVLKQNDDAPRDVGYISRYEDSRDLIAQLQSSKTHQGHQHVSLQRYVHGVELAVSRAFNGTDWVGPIKVNIEHKRFMNGDVGPMTGEMGTIAWFTDNEKNKLFRETLAKLKSYLVDIRFRGEIDINCIVNQSGAIPLEATPRFGSPICHLHSEFQENKWKDLLYAVASGKQIKVKYKKGFGVVVCLTVPPHPHGSIMRGVQYNNLDLNLDVLSYKEMEHVYFEEVSLVKRRYVLRYSEGLVGYVTGHGRSIPEARAKAYHVADKLIIPKVMYRTDIGLKFVNQDMQRLIDWGYITEADGVL